MERERQQTDFELWRSATEQYSSDIGHCQTPAREISHDNPFISFASTCENLLRQDCIIELVLHMANQSMCSKNHLSRVRDSQIRLLLVQPSTADHT